jgi:hypothetical protein
MTTFETAFAAGAAPALQADHGQAVTYTAPDGTPTACTAALVGEVRREQDPDEDGRVLRSSRDVMIFKSEVDPVSINGTVTIAGEVWSGFAIQSETGVATVLEVVRIGTAEVSRPGYRRQV